MLVGCVLEQAATRKIQLTISSLLGMMIQSVHSLISDFLRLSYMSFYSGLKAAFIKGLKSASSDHLCNYRGPRQRPGEDLPNDCKIYVGNISPIIDDNALREIFTPFGNVLHAAAVIDPMTKQTRGFGFVHMDNPTSAATAVRGMHGQVI